MKESENNPEPASTEPDDPNMPAKIPDLVARMIEKRAEFAQFRAQFADFRSGYKGRLYEYFQFAYEMNNAFVSDLDEMRRMTSDEFFNCNRQRPDEANFLRHLLYFLAEARTEKEREKWLKPATVLETFRSEGVHFSDVARRLKEGRGYKRIYNSISGKRFLADESSDDLDILDRDPLEAEDHAGLSERPAQSDTVDPAKTNDDGPNAFSLTPASDGNTTPPEDAEAAPSNPPGGSRSSAIAKAADEPVEAISEAAQAGGSGARPIRRNRSNTLFVNMQQFQIEMALAPKRGVIFYEKMPPIQGTLKEVVAHNVLPWDDHNAPWPTLIDPRELARLRGRDEASAPSGQAGQAGPANGGLPTDQPTPRSHAGPPKQVTAPDAGQGRGPNIPTGIPTASTSAMARPTFEESRVADGAVRSDAPARSQKIPNYPPLPKGVSKVLVHLDAKDEDVHCRFYCSGSSKISRKIFRRCRGNAHRRSLAEPQRDFLRELARVAVGISDRKGKFLLVVSGDKFVVLSVRALSRNGLQRAQRTGSKDRRS
jgi:hypothetical protein